ncbi:hypothetical protein BRC81_02930 [Halobacteriales archaeon QS_1_68_20]|nr:MAG: hypothetical protein BRC81_02930 [Halobacteriales archaeon QS_1_68_20]
MNRRSYLALLTAGLAGCTGGGEGTSTLTETPTGTPTTTATPTATPAGEPTPTETETPEPTETEEPTPAPEEIASEHIVAAEDHLATAVETYVGFAGDDAAWLDVDGSVSVDPSRLSDALLDMRFELSEARDHAVDEQADQIDALDHLREFLELVAQASAGAHDVTTSLRAAVDAAITENFDQMASHREATQQSLSTLGSDIDELSSTAQPDAAEATDVLSTEDYTKKIDQLASVHEDAGAVISGIGPMDDAMDDFSGGADAYYEEEYRTASTLFFGAKSTYADVKEDLSSDVAAAVSGVVGDARAYVSTLRTAAEHMVEAADSTGDWKPEHAARDVLRKSDLIEKSPTVSELLEYLES